MGQIIDNLRISTSGASGSIDRELHRQIARKAGIPVRNVRNYRILAKSVDSRKAPAVLVYKVEILVPDADTTLPNAPSPVDKEYSTIDQPIVVGTGPAGIFGALTLAIAGCRPLIFDRGFPVEQRIKDVENFCTQRVLNSESNLLIGEGGAGTFSDGKLYTGTKGRFSPWILQIMAQCGVPEEIRYLSRPHAGSDQLRNFSVNIRKKIESLGGTFCFGKCVTDIIEQDGICRGIVLDGNEEVLTSSGVILAPGLGGRELVRHLAIHRLDVQLKPFQTGCRIEHPQEFIDRTQYHQTPRPAALGAAEYHLARGGISSFCMCPGGEIVNASAWQNQCITNGMSYFRRDGEFANSCLISTIAPPAGASPDDVYQMIENTEKELFRRGGSDYAFPAQTARDFIKGVKSSGKINSSCRWGAVPGRVDDLLPESSADALKHALQAFDRQLPGFIRYGNFIGVESCVSSPVRIIRNELGEGSIAKLFPAGEGAGYAGGIISAANDGIRQALNLLEKAKA